VRALLVLLTLTALAAFAPAAGAAQQTSLAEIEEEVMCPVCGTLLQLAEAPQAQRQKVFISRLIEEGRSEQQIKDALVAEYGAEVLALPEGEGFNLSAYLVPIVAFLLAAIALAIGVMRWRRAGGGGPSQGGPAGRSRRLSGEETDRLDADLARYDL
jgi:cytochrome c-type biogenesis protein CcmH